MAEVLRRISVEIEIDTNKTTLTRAFSSDNTEDIRAWVAGVLTQYEEGR